MAGVAACTVALGVPVSAEAAHVVLVPRAAHSLRVRDLPADLRSEVEGQLGSGLIVDTPAAAPASTAAWRVVVPATAQPESQAVVHDPDFAAQWGLQLLEADWLQAGGLTGAGVPVAVVDSGIVATHRDRPLVGEAWDVTDNDTDVLDTLGHGTEVASVIAAPINGVGMQGLASGATILPVRVLSGHSTTTDFIAVGVRWAADHGARVINVSLGADSDPGGLMRDAIIHARAVGAVVVCAAGNDGSGTLAFPAAIPECLAVGAVDRSSLATGTPTRTWFSQYGTGLDLLAPGTGIDVASASTGLTTQGDGTSFAAPHVAAVAALLFQYGTMDGAHIEAQLTGTARDVGPAGWDGATGYGVLDAAAALGISDASGVSSLPPLPPPPPPPAPAPPAPSAPPAPAPDHGATDAGTHGGGTASPVATVLASAVGQAGSRFAPAAGSSAPVAPHAIASPHVVTGSDLADDLYGTALADLLNGRDGDDHIYGRGGADRLLGGPGADLLDGGDGNDHLTGGRGRDIVLAGRGADVVDVHDGAAGDVVRCGPGSDHVRADRGDRIARDCEHIDRRT